MKSEGSLEESLLANTKSLPTQVKETQQLTQKQKRRSEEYFKEEHFLFGKNFFQTLFFTWISPTLRYGNSVSLQQKAIPFLRDKDKPEIDFNNMASAFQNEMKSSKSKREGMTLVKSILKTFKKPFLLITFFCVIITFLQMYQPILSHDVIEYISSDNKTIKTGLIYFFTIFSINLFLSIVQTFIWYYFGVLGFNLSNTLSLLIYEKSLKHPLITQKQFSTSDIINYSQVDAQRLTYMGYQLVSLFYAPIQIIVGLSLLYWYIGPSFFVGLGVMIILMLFTLVFTKIAAKSNDDLLKAKDARMKVAQQILQIVKFIKTNALEKYFFRKINVKRQQELKLSKKVNLCYVASIFIFWMCPPIIVSMTFLVYVNTGNQISAAKAFFTIIIFNVLQSPMRMLPSAISELIQIWSSMKRIQKFLNSIELNKNCIQEYSSEGKYAIEIERGNFLWGKQKKKEQDKEKQANDKKKEKNEKIQEESPKQQQIRDSVGEQNMRDSLITQSEKSFIQNKETQKEQEKYTKALEDINIKFHSKEVTMIIGDIGSGKSSLLYAILNQMTAEQAKNPKIKINGSIAFSPQKAWIMTGTVKENITFFQPYNQQRFKDALKYSCLEDDLKILSKGIDTQIGEKGVNLSGGQKARVSLARSIYSNKDIYLLDDILSAVDVHVGNFIMEKTILQYLKGKTIIMPTHAVKYLEHADNIIIMKKGKVVTSGSYSHIRNSEEFQQILKLQEKKSEEKQAEKSSKEDESILNELRLVKQQTMSKQEKNNNNKNENKDATYTDKIVEQLIMPQDHHKGEVSLDVYLEYIKLNGGPIFVCAIIFCMSTWTVFSVASNIQIQKWCQNEDKNDKSFLYLYLGLAISATLFSGTRAYILVTSGIKQGRIMHKKVMKALLYTSITRFYNRVPVGRILNRLSKDLRQIDQAIGYAVGGFLVTFFSMTASLIMCIYASTPFVIFPIAIIALLCRFLLRYYLKSQRQCVRLQNITSSPIVSGFTSTVNGVGTIRAYSLQSEFLKLQLNRIQTNKRTRITREAVESWFALRLSLLSFVINMTALGYSILSGNENGSLAGLLLTYSGMLNDDIIGFAFSYAYVELKMISIERVNTFAKLEPEIGYSQYCKDWWTKEEGCNLNAIKDGNITMKNYSARYRDGLPLVINNLSLQISKGEKVGIVGRTGAGKSTLANCFLRIIEAAEGQILIDGKNIVDYSLKDLRSCITMIEQEPTLMNGNFRDNLDPANQYTDEQIKNILKQCNLSELVQEKGGLQAKVTNENLSVGQKQLLCICRAFLKRSRIILIDEATANIDVKNDKLIQDVISTAFHESTVLTIAHRLTTLQNCDKILVLGEGKALEWGDRKELLKKQGGIYRKMWEQNDNSYLH